MRPITVLGHLLAGSWLLGLGGGLFVVAGVVAEVIIFALSNKLFRRCRHAICC